jgi:hypothetical protein
MVAVTFWGDKSHRHSMLFMRFEGKSKAKQLLPT